jgi:Trk K+ transport system NAD-binding subunit
MFLITVFVAVISSGLTPDILLIGVLFLAFFFMYRFGMFFFNRVPVVRRTIEELSGATAQIKVRAAFTMMLIFVALSEVIGTEVILGAFLAGAIVSMLKRPEDAELEHQLNAIGFGFFIPIFFVMVGVEFNLGALLESPEALLLAPLLILAALAVKFIPSLVFKFAFSWRETFGAGAILSARLSLIIAAAAIGLRLGIVSESINAAIVLVALVTVSIAPVLFSRLIPSKEEGQEKLYIVVGAGELGNQVAEHLYQHQDHVLVVAQNEEQRARVEKRGMQAVIADADRDDPRLSPYFEKAQAVVCVYSDAEKSLRVCKQARLVYGIDNVVARVDETRMLSEFEKIGVVTMNAAMDQAALLAMLTRNSSLYNLLTRTDDDKDVCEVVVTRETYFGKRIRDLDFPEDLLIVALQRNGELLIPNGGTQLEMGDKLTLMGNTPCVERALATF